MYYYNACEHSECVVSDVVHKENCLSCAVHQLYTLAYAIVSILATVDLLCFSFRTKINFS